MPNQTVDNLIAVIKAKDLSQLTGAAKVAVEDALFDLINKEDKLASKDEISADLSSNVDLLTKYNVNKEEFNKVLISEISKDLDDAQKKQIRFGLQEIQEDTNPQKIIMKSLFEAVHSATRPAQPSTTRPLSSTALMNKDIPSKENEKKQSESQLNLRSESLTQEKEKVRDFSFSEQKKPGAVSRTSQSHITPEEQMARTLAFAYLERLNQYFQNENRLDLGIRGANVYSTKKEEKISIDPDFILFNLAKGKAEEHHMKFSNDAEIIEFYKNYQQNYLSTYVGYEECMKSNFWENDKTKPKEQLENALIEKYGSEIIGKRDRFKFSVDRFAAYGNLPEKDKYCLALIDFAAGSDTVSNQSGLSMKASEIFQEVQVLLLRELVQTEPSDNTATLLSRYRDKIGEISQDQNKMDQIMLQAKSTVELNSKIRGLRAELGPLKQLINPTAFVNKHKTLSQSDKDRYELLSKAGQAFLKFEEKKSSLLELDQSLQQTIKDLQKMDENRFGGRLFRRKDPTTACMEKIQKAVAEKLAVTEPRQEFMKQLKAESDRLSKNSAKYQGEISTYKNNNMDKYDAALKKLTATHQALAAIEVYGKDGNLDQLQRDMKAAAAVEANRKISGLGRNHPLRATLNRIQRLIGKEQTRVEKLNESEKIENSPRQLNKNS